MIVRIEVRGGGNKRESKEAEMKRNTTKCKAQWEVRLKMNRRLAAGQSS